MEARPSLTVATDSNKDHPLWARNHLVTVLLNVKIKKDTGMKIKIRDYQLTKTAAN